MFNKREYMREYNPKYYAENKDKFNNKDYKNKWYQDKAGYLRDRRLKQRDIVYKEYGNKCNCCSEIERMFLTIDHVNNDGRIERKSRGGSSDQIIRKIIKNNFP